MQHRSLPIRGFTLFECLLALSLLSALCILCLEVQTHLFQHLRYLSLNYAAVRRQTSLIERYKSCQGCAPCLSKAYQQEQNILQCEHPATIRLTEHPEGLSSVIQHASQNTIPITFNAA